MSVQTLNVRFLPESRLEDWLALLAAQAKVLAPLDEGGSRVFRRWEPGQSPDLSAPAVASPKAAVFPQAEDVLRVAAVKDPEHPAQVRHEISVPEPVEPRLIFGCRPCDAAGFLLLDAVLKDGPVRDPSYVSRRSVTRIVALACDAPFRGCFCHWVGGGPHADKGADVLLRRVLGGFLARAVTEAGGEMLQAEVFAAATPAQEAEAQAHEAACLQALGPAPDLSGVGRAFLASFADLGLWEELAGACLSCGACTHLCPACSCFNLTDEQEGGRSRRIRTWDSCLYALYSLEASGHNPRPTKAHRMRNRVGHKFCYHALRGNQGFSCTGCGRCVRHCPADVDIRVMITRLAALSAASEEGR